MYDLNALRSFWVYARSDSMTNILLHLKLPSFATVTHNASVVVAWQHLSTSNGVIDYLNHLVLEGFYSILLCVRECVVDRPK